MAQTYTVGRNPERLDRIAKKLFGTELSGTVEALLAANRGLAAMLAETAGEVPAGTVLQVPVVTTTTTSTFVPPWT